MPHLMPFLFNLDVWGAVMMDVVAAPGARGKEGRGPFRALFGISLVQLGCSDFARTVSAGWKARSYFARYFIKRVVAECVSVGFDFFFFMIHFYTHTQCPSFDISGAPRYTAG
jgi:hypothetical protein